ncbi:MAG: cytochrome c oxidase assembly protein [Acidimicrobiia bacterium]
MVTAAIPAWNPHPDVWILIALIAAGYAIAAVRLGPRLAPDPAHPVTRLQYTALVVALLGIWVASDWPMHDVSERSMYSVHMVQHLMFTTLGAPLLLIATPGWLARWILSPAWLLRTLRTLSRFLPGVLIAGFMVSFSHWPAFVQLSIQNGLVHFVAHVMLVVTSLIVWMPLLSPLPEVPRLSIPLRCGYLFVQSFIPTLPATFLTYGDSPLYRIYERFPKLWGLSALEDQQIAGLIMKTAGGLILWLIITVLFFRWAGEEERQQRMQSKARRPIPNVEFTQ